MATEDTKLKSHVMMDQLTKCGITHIVWLPATETRFMYESMLGQHDIVLVPVCREGEAMAIATGLILGGKNPVVLVQNCGFFEAGDSYRGMVLNSRVSFLMLIGYRGWQRGKPLTDTAAIYAEPILDAWGIKHYLVETSQDLEKISDGYQEVIKTNKVVAIMFGREFD